MSGWYLSLSIVLELAGITEVAGAGGRWHDRTVDYLDATGFFELSMIQFFAKPLNSAFADYKAGRLESAARACEREIEKGAGSEAFVLRLVISDRVRSFSSFHSAMTKEIQSSIAKRTEIPLSRAIGIFTAVSGSLRSGNVTVQNTKESLIVDYVRKKSLGKNAQLRNDLILQCVAASYFKRQEDERRFGEALVRAYPKFAPGYAYCASRYLSGHSAVFDGMGRQTGEALRPNFPRAAALVKKAIELDSGYARAWYVNASVHSDRDTQRESLRRFLNLAPPYHPKVMDARAKLAKLGG